jgi:hypothetical protein
MSYTTPLPLAWARRDVDGDGGAGLGFECYGARMYVAAEAPRG